jgi:hypothetical protein
MKHTLFTLLFALLLLVPKAHAQTVLVVRFDRLVVDSVEVSNALTGPTGYKTIVVDTDITPSTAEYRFDYVIVTAAYKTSTGHKYKLETTYNSIQSTYRLNGKLAMLDKTGTLDVAITAWYNKTAGTGPIAVSAGKSVRYPVALPVTLVSFDVRGNKAYWVTSTESNVNRFEVQSSTGGTWRTVSSAKPHGPGSYALALPQQDGLTYYRLRSLDNDGTEAFSAVRAVQGGLDDTVVDARYTDLAGRTVPKPTAGFYVEVLTHASGAVERRKVYQQ